MKADSVTWFFTTVILLAAACSGSPPGGGRDTDDSRPGDDAEPTPDEPLEGVACAAERDGLPPVRVWRLSGRQLANTLRAIFEVEVDERLMPAAGKTRTGFAAYDTAWREAVVSELVVAGLRDVARKTVSDSGDRLFAGHECVLGDDTDDACTDAFIEHWGRLLYRRPLLSEETTRFRAWMAGLTGELGAKLAGQTVVEAMILSPNFVYRSELGTDEGEVRRLSQHEVASQLSYLLVDGPPDSELMAAADDTLLSEPAVVQQHALRLMQSPGFRDKVRDFFVQYLRLENLRDGAVTKETDAFPTFSAKLGQDMFAASEAFVTQVLFDEEAPLSALFSSRQALATPALAALYEVPHPGGDGLANVELPAARQGLLGQAALLTTLSHERDTSPEQRGYFVLQNLLCTLVPDPPPGAAGQADGKIRKSDEPDFTMREHFDFASETAPECMSCHGVFVPLGLGLEAFDAVGRFRREHHGKSIDTAVELAGFDEADGRYDDTVALVASAMNTRAGQSCLARQWGTFALGWYAQQASACEVDALTDAFSARGGRMVDLILAQLEQPSFYHRAAER